MKVEELIDITNKIDDILHGYGIVIDHDILTHHLFKAIKESYPNDNIELEPPDLRYILGLKTLPEIV
jgi:hypothetical protein